MFCIPSSLVHAFFFWAALQALHLSARLRRSKPFESSSQLMQIIQVLRGVPSSWDTPSSRHFRTVFDDACLLSVLALH